MSDFEMDEVPDPNKYWAVDSDIGMEIETKFNKLDFQSVAIEAANQLSHDNPEEHHLRMKKVRAVGKAMIVGTSMAVSAWALMKGHNSAYEQLVDGFKQFGSQ